MVARRFGPHARSLRGTWLRALAAAWVLALAGSRLLAGEAADIVARHLAAFDAMSTLLLRVERQTTIKDKTQIERWTFRRKAPGRFRVDYEFPLRRTLVANDTDLWEYIPDAGKAAHTDLRAMTAEQRLALFRSVLQRVALDGLRFEAGGADTKLRYVGLEEVEGRPAHCIECQREGDGETRLVRGWIDVERHVLLRCEFVGKGGHTLAIAEAGGVFEAAPGVWFPRKLTFKALGPKGMSQAISFTRIVINGDMADADFDFKLPEGVQVVKP